MNGYYITQTWGGLGNQTGIERPTKYKFPMESRRIYIYI